MKDLQKLVADFEVLAEEFEEKAGTVLTTSFATIFEQVPELDSIRWEQYTPGFNDGDPCTFRVTEPKFKFLVDVTGKGADEMDEDYEDGYFDTYILNNKWLRAKGIDPYSNTDESVKKKIPVKDILDAVGELIQSSALERVLESIYGNGTQITVSRDGVTTDDYDCGY